VEGKNFLGHGNIIRKIEKFDLKKTLQIKFKKVILVNTVRNQLKIIRSTFSCDNIYFLNNIIKKD
jgi:hypothetical protein